MFAGPNNLELLARAALAAHIMCNTLYICSERLAEQDTLPAMTADAISAVV